MSCIIIQHVKRNMTVTILSGGNRMQI